MGATFSTGLIDTLRTGAWLTRARVRLWGLAVLVAAAGGLVYLLATANGLIDFQGRPLGTDFSSFHAAGTHALAGAPAFARTGADSRSQRPAARPRIMVPSVGMKLRVRYPPPFAT